ncbi:inositol polyphosphate phosphatase [Favolaschia claudopus]|uniref:Inositol polyphosphate phosphatase n=1 Tax=Favolaschia claudopus TaxID=2862362 RepID=A0AAW0B314_9AGAR
MPHADLAHFFSLNSEWAKRVRSQEPEFFAKSATGQAPKLLWIGCADSRVPESVVTAVRPGEIFVHRNIANQFHLEDNSVQSVLTYAVNALGVEHVVVVGHSECGGAAACFGAANSAHFNPSAQVCTIVPGLEPDAPLNQWLTPLTKLVAALKLSSVPKAEALPLIVEENVRRQVQNLCMAQTIVDAWTDNKKVWVHGWVYDLAKGDNGVPQDLVDWLSPTLQVSTFLSHQRPADIVAVAFQELLPLHLGLSGLSTKVINNRNAHILEQIEANSLNKERYALISKVVNGGVALLVYARDAGVARTACDVHTSWTGSGPGYMANKGAVGVRFRVPGEDGSVGEVFTFVCAHLTAHAENISSRIADWHHIVGTLLFPANDGKLTSTLYDTSHLFLHGDLNFRVVLPPEHPLKGATSSVLGQTLSSETSREELKEYDQLLLERRNPASRAFIGLREGEFWRFKCSYKYSIGEVDKYSEKRTPSWTDRILYTTYTDSSDSPNESAIKNLLYTSVPGYTTSDHKPVVSLLLLPAPSSNPSPDPPTLRLPPHYTPAPSRHATLKRYTGRILDRVVGRVWWLLTLLGAGSAVIGLFNFVVGLGAWGWWARSGYNFTRGENGAV